MRTSLLLVCALVSAGLLSGPADARQRNDERQDRREQRQERAQEQRQERAQEQRQERVQEQREPRRTEGRRDDRGDRGDRSADAARLAQQRNGGGRVLAVEPEGRGYRVKVLKDGEVRTHHIDVDN